MKSGGADFLEARGIFLAAECGKKSRRAFDRRGGISVGSTMGEFVDGNFASLFECCGRDSDEHQGFVGKRNKAEKLGELTVRKGFPREQSTDSQSLARRLRCEDWSVRCAASAGPESC